MESFFVELDKRTILFFLFKPFHFDLEAPLEHDLSAESLASTPAVGQFAEHTHKEN